MNQPPAVAAVISRQSGDCDAAVTRCAARLQAAGHVVRGLVQECGCGAAAGKMHLVDVESGTRYPITQPLGPGSESCSLDASLLADAGHVLRRIQEEGADLAIFNRFGNQEAAGQGFFSEMLALMSHGMPVMVIVPANHLDAWRNFTGGVASELPPDETALQEWFASVTLTRHGQS